MRLSDPKTDNDSDESQETQTEVATAFPELDEEQDPSWFQRGQESDIEQR